MLSASLSSLLWLAVVLSLISFFSTIVPFFTGAHWVPTPVSTVRRMLRLANVQPGEMVYDLGSGDGRVLFIAAREFGARAVGVEIDPLKYLWTRAMIALLGLGDRVTVHRANFFDVALGEADVITLYLLPKANARLLPKFKRELRPGARVVVNTFFLPEWPVMAEEKNVRVYKFTTGY